MWLIELRQGQNLPLWDLLWSKNSLAVAFTIARMYVQKYSLAIFLKLN